MTGPLTLRELEATFLKRIMSCEFKHVENIAEADGVKFLCPVCFVSNGHSNVGTHGVICWSPSVPQDTHPTPGRWSMVGTGIDDLTLVAVSSSVLLKGGCAAHFFVRNGKIEM